jgi:hypothetical protein
VAYVEDKAVRIAQPMLEPVFEGAIAVAVASSSVGQDEELGSSRIAGLPFVAPPAGEAIGGELGGVVRRADVESTAIGEHIVDVIRNRETQGLGTEVMIIDEDVFLAPGPTGVLEVADEFLLLRVDGDGRLAAVREALTELGDVEELLVAIRIGAARQLLMIRT